MEVSTNGTEPQPEPPDEATSSSAETPSFQCHKCLTVLTTAARLAKHLESQPAYCVKAERKRQRIPVLPVNDAPSSKECAPDTFHIKVFSLRSNCATLSRIPKSARLSAAEAFRKVIQKCVSENDWKSWCALLTFAFNALQVPETNDNGKKRSLTTLVKENIVAFESNPSYAFKGNQTRRRKKGDPDSELRKRVTRKIQNGDVSGAVRTLTSEDTVAPYTAEVLEALRQKHPPGDPEYSFSPEEQDNNASDVTPEEISVAVAGFPNGSSAGLDGLTPQHVKDMLGKTNDRAQGLREALASLITLMLRGQVPDEVCPFIYGGRLLGLTKKDGGVRPIAVGNTVRRIAGKVISARIVEQVGTLLRPVQLGYGTKGGAEAIAHGVREFLEVNRATPVLLLKIDFRNAFNSVRRTRVMEEVKQHIPQYSHFICQNYGKPSCLLFGGDVVSSAAGVQQGDPLGPMEFSLAIHPTIASLKSRLNVWYLDDGVLGGDPAVVLQDLQTLLNAERTLGLELNLGKCEFFVSGGSEESQIELKRSVQSSHPLLSWPRPEDLTLLGAPLIDYAVEHALEEKAKEVSRLVSKLSILEPHHGFFLLRSSLSIPKLMYLLRTSRAWKFPNGLAKFDEVLRQSLQQLTNLKIDGSVWNQATLPVRSGGLGIRRAGELCITAYLASVHSVAALVSRISGGEGTLDLSDAETAWKQQAKGADLPPVLARVHQKSWDTPVVQAQYQELLEQLGADPRHRARLLAMVEKESGAWLEAYPLATLGNLLTRHVLRMAIGYRLGAKVCHSHRCQCGAQVDEYGHHGFVCRMGNAKYVRHSGINDVFLRTFGTCGFPAVREPCGLSPDDQMRPDGMTLHAFNNGFNITWDVTVVDTQAETYLDLTKEKAGAAAEEAEKRKRRNYRFLEENYIFAPLAFETSGVFGVTAKDIVSKLGNLVRNATGEPRSTAFLKQKLSLEIQRGNAACMLSTVGNVNGLEEIFYVLGKR